MGQLVSKFPNPARAAHPQTTRTNTMDLYIAAAVVAVLLAAGVL